MTVDLNHDQWMTAVDIFLKAAVTVVVGAYTIVHRTNRIAGKGKDDLLKSAIAESAANRGATDRLVERLDRMADKNDARMDRLDSKIDQDRQQTHALVAKMGEVTAQFSSFSVRLSALEGSR